MDGSTLVELFRATFQPGTQVEAEKQLKMVNFKSEKIGLLLLFV